MHFQPGQFFGGELQQDRPVSAGLDLRLPIRAAVQRAPQRLPGEIIVNVRASGENVVNGRTLASDELGAMLERLAGIFPGQPILIRADKQAPFEHVISVLDLCRRADIWNISFATSVPEAETP